jgi:hypothetical protein
VSIGFFHPDASEVDIHGFIEDATYGITKMLCGILGTSRFTLVVDSSDYDPIGTKLVLARRLSLPFLLLCFCSLVPLGFVTACPVFAIGRIF